MKVAIQGQAGSFHEAAAQIQFGQNIEPIYCETFTEVFEMLSSQKADQAIVAIENSLYGAISNVYDLLQIHHFPIVGELFLHIHQHLIGLSGAHIREITRVYSQPPALVQCHKFLQENLPNAEQIEYRDTAAAVELIGALGDPHYAAIAGRTAAEKHALHILRENIEDDQQNFTRFLILNPHGTPPTGADKATITLTTKHAPGALHEALGIFAAHDINLTNLHSRPIPTTPWQYQFYTDAETSHDNLHSAIAELEQNDVTVHVLGEYKKSNALHTT